MSASGVQAGAGWLDDLDGAHFAAWVAFVEVLLQRYGKDIPYRNWIKALGEGLFERWIDQSERSLRSIFVGWRGGLDTEDSDFASGVLHVQRQEGRDRIRWLRQGRLDPVARVQLNMFKEAFSVGAQLAQRGRELSLTQAAVATRSGVQQADVSRIERGMVVPSMSTVQRLADALDARWVLVDANSVG